MNSILFLYDTQEKDLARDFVDFLAELDLDIKMIPLSPNQEKTLQTKEEHHFDSVEGAIFLITPGSERLGKLFPSPSVADEMGQAKQKFRNQSGKFIYLVDIKCNIQAVDQKPYIPFDRNNIRSIVESITVLIKTLKQSGLFARKKIEPRETPGIDIARYSAEIDDTLKRICFDLSDRPNGFIKIIDFDYLLKTKYKMSNRDTNFTKRDLQTKGLLAYIQTYAGWQLTNIGWELVRHEIEMEKKKRASNPPMGLLPGLYNANVLGSLPSALPTNYAISPKRVGLLSEALRRENDF